MYFKSHTNNWNLPLPWCDRLKQEQQRWKTAGEKKQLLKTRPLVHSFSPSSSFLNAMMSGPPPPVLADEPLRLRFPLIKERTHQHTPVITSCLTLQNQKGFP